MNAPRSRMLLSIGLILLMAGLFAALFRLNLRQYRITMANVETALLRTLDQQKKIYLQHITQAEEARFALYETERVLEADLFLDQDSGIIPACISSIAPTIPESEAAASFKYGIDNLPSKKALPYFMTAAHGPEDSEKAVYRKAAALFNLLDFDQSPQTTCSILALLERGKNKLTNSQHSFFRTMLEEQVPALGPIEQRLGALQQTARLIEARNDLSGGPYRMVLHDRLLSVRENGLAVLFTPDFPELAPIEISPYPAGTYREIIPGLYAVAAGDAFTAEKSRIRKQYHSGNIILALTGLLGAALLTSLLSTEKRQRQLDAMRRQFTATVSHELRTPLSLIRLHAETLHHGRVPDEKIADYHKTILTESERLTGIVNNVLDFSRIERGKLELHLETVNLSECTNRIVDSFRYRAEQENYNLTRTIDPNITAEVDPLAWSQILFNLLDNALKYSNDNRQISITLRSVNESCELLVADWGIGIPDRLKRSIFDDYVRSDDSRVTARRGSGIGLSVARQLTERMNGSIRVEDNSPNGSIFTVQLRKMHETADCR